MIATLLMFATVLHALGVVITKKLIKINAIQNNFYMGIEITFLMTLVFPLVV
jgi:hypothetical protein